MLVTIRRLPDMTIEFSDERDKTPLVTMAFHESVELLPAPLKEWLMEEFAKDIIRVFLADEKGE